MYSEFVTTPQNWVKQNLYAKVEVGQLDNECLFVVPLAFVPGDKFIFCVHRSKISGFLIVLVTTLWWQKVGIDVVQIPLKVVAFQLLAKFYPVCHVTVRYIFGVRINLKIRMYKFYLKKIFLYANGKCNLIWLLPKKNFDLRYALRFFKQFE